MKIGIDAKWFYTGNASGRIVIQNLLKTFFNLTENNNPAFIKHKYIIILDRKDKNIHFPYANKYIYPVYLKVFFNNQITNLLSPLFLRKYKLDICLFQYFAPFFSRFKKVVYIHDIIFQVNPSFFTLKERMYFSTIKILSKKADGIITVSEAERKRMLFYNYPGSKTKIKVIYNGVDNKFKPSFQSENHYLNYIKKKYNLPERYLLYVGRLNERKNIPSLLHALKELKNSNIPLFFVGNYDWKMFNLPRLIEDLNLTTRTRLLGFVNDDDVAGIYCLASVFCYVSYDEGFGMPPIEAMSSGIPLVISDIPVLHETCGDAAFYVNPRKPLEISNTIDHVLNGGKDVTDKINDGLIRAKLFQWETSVAELIKFFEIL